MPQRSLASLVLAPVLLGILSLALACVAGERTDRLGDTLRVSDTLHVASAEVPTDTTPAAAVPRDSMLGRQDTVALQQGGSARVNSSTHHHATALLSPRADSIAADLVFVPRNRIWFTAASRGKQMLVDIGRADLAPKLDSTARAAYLEAVSRLSPLPAGTVLRLRGPWGQEDAPVTGFGLWNGRIVAKLQVSHTLESMARRKDYLPATAVRLADSSIDRPPPPLDSAAKRKPGLGDPKRSVRAAVATKCQRDSISVALAARGGAVRDSLVRFLSDSASPPFERLVKLAKVESWAISGCFGRWPLLVMANKRTPEMEFSVERVVLLDSAGRVFPAHMSDLSFHAHVPRWVFDADGDGIDDLAVHGYGESGGGYSIVRLDTASRRFSRLASGFVWER